MTRYETCLSCENHCQGLCVLDGKMVESHAESGVCPAGNYHTGDADGVPVPLTFGKVLHGAVGIAKAILHVDAATRDMIDSRTTLCDACKGNDRGVCRVCHCDIWSKVRNASEACPWNKWGAHA